MQQHKRIADKCVESPSESREYTGTAFPPYEPL